MASPVAATINESGITAPPYSAIYAYFVAQYQAIFGADAYLGNDSQDGQWIGIVAQALADCNSSSVAVYNSFSPVTGQGNGLSSNVKINGLTRLAGSFSTALVTIVGQANTPIQNGLAQDGNGNTWALPSLVTIPNSGTIDVIATCATLGAVAAAPGSISTIQTPIQGWQSVTNSSAASLGNPVETDAQLRLRQAASTAAPAHTVFDGIIADIAAVTGVIRVAGYENNTAGTDGNGVPAGDLAFVVDGGNVNAIAAAIAAKISPGVPTYQTGSGGQSVAVTDSKGYTKTINFMTHASGTTATINVNLTIHGLNGWSTATEAIITAALSAYLANLSIQAANGAAQILSYTGLIVAAYLPGTPYAGTFLIKAMTFNLNNGGNVTTDISVPFSNFPEIGNVVFTIV